jgi:hypothetical protein
MSPTIDLIVPSHYRKLTLTEAQQKAAQGISAARKRERTASDESFPTKAPRGKRDYRVGPTRHSRRVIETSVEGP